MTHARGWLDTRDNIQDVFHEDVLISSLKLRHMTFLNFHADLDVNDYSKYALLLTHGEYILSGERMPPISHIKAVAIGELIAPMLPTTYFLPTNEANEHVTAIINHYLDNETSILKNRTKTEFIAVHNNLPEDERDEDWAVIPAGITNDDLLNNYGRNYIMFLLSANSTGLHYSGIELFATIFIAIAKRGNVSELFVEKIISGINDDLQYTAR